MPAKSPLRLVLASTSPYRRELLARLRIPFETAAPDVDESPAAGETPSELALRLACAKARAAQTACPDALIIGCDQVAVAGATILSKPGSHDKAVEQLMLMSGQPVLFYTALCLLNARTSRQQVSGSSSATSSSTCGRARSAAVAARSTRRHASSTCSSS